MGDFFAEHARVDGLGKQIGDAERLVSDGFLLGDRAGADQDGQHGKEGAQFDERVEAVEVGHFVVENRQVKRLGAQGFKGFLAVEDAGYLIPGIFEQKDEHVAKEHGIVGDENAGGGSLGHGHARA